MKIIIDTNIVLDILQKRTPFFTSSYQALKKCIEDNIDCLISASSATDIYYILRRSLHSSEIAKETLERFSHIVAFADVQGIDICTAFSRNMPDFEDAVVDVVAEQYGCEYILTRNLKDFTGSVIPAIAPDDFLKL